MAGTRSCLSSILLGTFLLLLATASARVNHLKGAVSPFCTTATTAPDDKAVCTELVKGAKTWGEAMTNAIKEVIARAKAAKPTVVDSIPGRIPPGLRPATKDSIAKGCQDSFDTYVYNLEQSIGFVKNDPTSALETYLSGSTFFDCKDGFDEFQLSDADVNRFYDQTNKFADILLSIYQTKPN